MEVIIYKQDSGVLSIVYPTQEALASKSLIQIGEESIPIGKRFKVIESELLPSDRANRASWSWPDWELTDGIGAKA